jgi:hypothetical protein
MAITLDGTNGITTPDLNATAQTSNLVTTGDISAADLTLSGGVFLGGTGSANKLDDYEEGTWTPSVNIGTGTSTNSGIYTKIGNMVYISFRIFINTTGNASGSMGITNFPFAPTGAMGNLFQPASIIRESGLTGASYRVRQADGVFQAFVTDLNDGGLNFSPGACYTATMSYPTT